MCVYVNGVYIYIHNKYTHVHTQICQQKLLFWMQLIAINCLTALYVTETNKLFSQKILAC